MLRALELDFIIVRLLMMKGIRHLRLELHHCTRSETSVFEPKGLQYVAEYKVAWQAEYVVSRLPIKKSDSSTHTHTHSVDASRYNDC